MEHLILSRTKAVDHLNVRQSCTDLRLIGTVTGEWVKLTQQWHGLILICQKQSWQDETVVVQWVVTKFKMLTVKVKKIQDYTVFTSADRLDLVLPLHVMWLV